MHNLSENITPNSNELDLRVTIQPQPKETHGWTPNAGWAGLLRGRARLLRLLLGLLD